MALEFVPTGGGLGADIKGLDVDNVSESEADQLRQAFLDFLLLRVRDTDLDDDRFLRFARVFGELELSPKAIFDGKGWIEGYPELSQVSNKKVDGKNIGSLSNSELVWHTDMSYIEAPPTASLLYALEVPESGGDTGFLNMYTAYETLPDDLKTAIQGKSVRHDERLNSSGVVRSGYSKDAVENVTEMPGARHPIIRTHPDTGRQALFLGRRQNSWVVDMPVDESDDLLDLLWAHATTNPAFTWAQQWKLGDVVIWDNRCTMHRRDAFDDSQVRHMHRTVIKGDKPFFRAEAA
ncbi:MAG: taurine catabolism dioxygenase TauD [Rhodospirillaceae bacterium]|nr:taurine catabolism dioxygenase TauD [Rhodospirillaceae bacterium]